MAKLPNLYVKWRAFRELIGKNPSDATIAADLLEVDNAAISFSRLKKGELDCTPKIARGISHEINQALEKYRKSKGASGPAPAAIRESDLEASALSFTRRLIKAAEIVDEATMERVHNGLLDELQPPRQSGPVKLEIESESEPVERFPVPFKKRRRIVFDPTQRFGRFTITGVPKAPNCAYALCTRDPAPAGRHIWELDWDDTVRWLDSPFHPIFQAKRLLLSPDAEEIDMEPGRFILTIVLVWHEEIIGKLDPRGARPHPDGLDESDTSRFLTNLRRVATDADAVSVASAEYFVKI